MTDYSELKWLADAATPGPWECREAEGSAAICHEHGWIADDFSEQTLVDTRYMAAANPAAVLALIAENEALHAQVKTLQADPGSWQSGYVHGRAMGTKTALAERGQLKAENEALRKALGLARHWCDSALRAAQSNDPADTADSLLDVACLLRHQASDIDAAMSKEAGQ